MCNITLQYVSGSGCYLIDDLGLSISSVEENLISHLFSVQDLIESQDLNSAIINGDLEAKVNGQIIQNANQLCNTSGLGSGKALFSQTFSINGLVEVQEINFNPNFYLIAKDCQLDTVAGIGNGSWLLDVVASPDNGIVWTPILSDILIDGFTSFENLNLALTSGDIVKARYKKLTSSISNPKVTLLFNI